MVFDTWGGVLSDAAYREFSLAYARRCSTGVTRTDEGRVVPRILFTKGGGLWLESHGGGGRRRARPRLDRSTSATRAGASATGSRCRATWIRRCSSPRRKRSSARRGASWTPSERGPGHVFNLGHGISQFTSPEHVQALVEAVHRHSVGAHARLGRVKQKIFTKVIAYSHTCVFSRRGRPLDASAAEQSINLSYIQDVTASFSPAE